MKIHEYQAKEIFAEYGIPVEAQEVVSDSAAVRAAAEKLGLPVVVKAQVLVGGRGKAGGVKLAKTAEEAETRGKEILGLTIKDLPVEKVLVTPAADIEKEYYVGMIMDRANKTVTLMMTAEGGVEIEVLAVERPDAIKKMQILPASGIDDGALKPLVEEVFGSNLASQATEVIHKLYQVFMDKDCSLVEINPYALVPGDKLKALDAKMNFDDNALYKHPEVEAIKDPTEESADEIEAKENGLSFVSMDGDIGCIVNGAGLAMATMDIIKLYGGEPANFLDVGGSSNPNKVVKALEIIMRNPRVKAILINIFGGITRCDDIANGILIAKSQIDIPVPVVIRLVGTNEVEGKKILADAGLQVGTDLSESVQKVVELGGAA